MGPGNDGREWMSRQRSLRYPQLHEFTDRPPIPARCGCG
jgi:hypothetical protein